MIRKILRLELLSVIGLASLVTAAWLFHQLIGLVALGIALLLLEWRLEK
jgi:hypothetical protein